MDVIQALQELPDQMVKEKALSPTGAQRIKERMAAVIAEFSDTPQPDRNENADVATPEPSVETKVDEFDQPEKVTEVVPEPENQERVETTVFPPEGTATPQK